MTSLINTIVANSLIGLLVALLVVLLFFLSYFIVTVIKFNNTTYHKITHKSYLNTRGDKGRFGEYYTYLRLRDFENKNCRFLFNCYLPKGEGQTTEIDVLMICHSGIFVFESKNYSGWIFGSEKYKNWTVTLPRGKGRSIKNSFQNPIMQNKLHIRCLKEYIGEDIPLYLVIVFSERCTLKKVDVSSEDVHVIKRDVIQQTVKKICTDNGQTLDDARIEEIYNKLYPCTQVTEDVKIAHIENIKAGVEGKQEEESIES